MMRASRQEQTGGVGVNEVAANFERIGWGPVPNAQHDLGTDLLVQARDARLFDRGLVVGVQAKSGPGYFELPANAEDGSVLGWWNCERGLDHFDNWVTHGLPHLVVLHNLGIRKSVLGARHRTGGRVHRPGRQDPGPGRPDDRR
jgi:hypothetical protein